MKKSTLLGGTARIIREPSIQDMQLAMLRRLAPAKALDVETDKSEARDPIEDDLTLRLRSTTTRERPVVRTRGSPLC